jgi:biotin carboxyl carrier protein
MLRRERVAREVSMKPASTVEVQAQIAGTIWKIEKLAGAQLSEEEVILILESMKMEIPVESPCAGRLREIRVTEGQGVEEGDVLAVIDA